MASIYERGVEASLLQVIDEISPRSKDSIVGFGEKLGCKFIVAVLRDHVRSLGLYLSHSVFMMLLTQGIDAEYVSLENIVPPYDEVGGTLGQDFYDRVSDAFAARIRQCGPRVPVVTGSFLKYFPLGFGYPHVGHRILRSCARFLTKTSGARVH